MRSLGRLLALSCLAVLALSTPLTAQRVEAFGGVGGAIEVEDDFLPYAQGILGARVGIGPVLGIRAGGWVNWLGSSDQYAGVDLDVTTFFTANEQAAVRPYVLAGGSLIFRGDDPDFALNGAAGIRVRLAAHVGLLVEPRFYLALDDFASTPSFAVFTVGLAYRF